MVARIAFLTLPLLAWAQTPASAPPPEVDQALRDRATQFFQFIAAGNFRKAYDLVAEDTKDMFFNAPKERIDSFKLRKIEYSDNFTKASVTVNVSRTVYVLGTTLPTSSDAQTDWKMVDGQWEFYLEPRDAIVSPHSSAQVPGKESAPALPPSLPKDVSPAGILAAGQQIMGKSGLDKSAVTFKTDQASEVTLTFHNGLPGAVDVELATPKIPGFSAELEKKQAGPGGNVALVLRYQPDKGTPPADPMKLMLVASPPGLDFPITVTFSSQP
jgi:hypothetical protein